MSLEDFRIFRNMAESLEQLKRVNNELLVLLQQNMELLELLRQSMAPAARERKVGVFLREREEYLVSRETIPGSRQKILYRQRNIFLPSGQEQMIIPATSVEGFFHKSLQIITDGPIDIGIVLADDVQDIKPSNKWYTTSGGPGNLSYSWQELSRYVAVYAKSTTPVKIYYVALKGYRPC